MRDIPTVCKYSLGELKVCEEEIKNPGQGSSKVLKRLSSEQFYTKAKKAIGDILINKVKVEHSTSSTQPCSSLISLLGSKISMEEDERSSSCSLQPINSVIVHYCHHICEGIDVSNRVHSQIQKRTLMKPNMVSLLAKGLYDKIQAKIRQLFKKPLILCKGMSSPDIDQMEAEVRQPMAAPSALCFLWNQKYWQ